MNGKEFDALLDRRLDRTRTVLGIKADEYANPYDGDCLHNFRRQAEMQRTSMAKAAWALVSKQIISLQDMIESSLRYKRTQWDEKIGDIINYLILIEAIVQEDSLALPEYPLDPVLKSVPVLKNTSEVQ